MTATRKQGAAAVAPGSAARGTVGATLRVLIYIEDRHCTYREAIAELLQSRCPTSRCRSVASASWRPSCFAWTRTSSCTPGRECRYPTIAPCWVELSLDPALPTQVQLGGIRHDLVNPSFSDLLAVIDQAASLCR